MNETFLHRIKTRTNQSKVPETFFNKVIKQI